MFSAIFLGAVIVIVATVAYDVVSITLTELMPLPLFTTYSRPADELTATLDGEAPLTSAIAVS